ncbi:MAG TPA: flap endonuclease-1 [Candidatus Norongarragalinales archaeon]|nr:flap endonuclease-1 [Candidatus Norongarragalinales archaeon]
MGVAIGDILQVKKIAFEEMRGRIAIDAYNTLYQFLSIIRQPDGTPLMDSKGRVTSHLSGLFYRTCSMVEKGLQPIFVFDGPPSELKKRTLAERRERKQLAAEEFVAAKEAGKEEEMKIFAQQTTKLTKEMAEESKHLLRLLGIPVVQAKSEGEAQCAHMCRKGLVAATGSQDFDALLFGTPVLLKNLTIAGRRKLPRKNIFVEVVPERIELQPNLDALGITQKKLIWIGILAGTDFNKGIYGIGAKKALKLVREFDTFEGIIGKLGKDVDYKPVEKLFFEPDVVDVPEGEIVFSEPDRDKLMDFMLDRNFTIERVQSALQRAFKEPFGTRQSNLSKWF